MAGSEKYDNNWRHEDIPCPKCSTQIRYYDTEGSSYYACPNCHTYFKQDGDEKPQIIREFNSRFAVEQLLPIGRSGYLDKKKFKVIGYICKWEPKENIYWTEYMLYHPGDDDYSVLAEINEEWYLIWKAERQDFDPVNKNTLSPEYVIYENEYQREYYFYAGYYFHVQYARGEFDTDILDDDGNLRVEEYMALPHMLVSERKKLELSWYRGRNMLTSEINRAFNLNLATSEELRHRKREKFFERWNLTRNFSAVVVLIMLAALWLIGVAKPAKRLAYVQYNEAASPTYWDSIQVLSGGQVTIDGPAAVNFKFTTNLYNKWTELAVTMVNTETGKIYEFTKVIEYYTGNEGGESWSEGDREAEAVISRVPSGTYQINIYPTMEIKDDWTLSMEVEQNTTLYSNFILCFVLILIYPALQLFVKDIYDDH